MNLVTICKLLYSIGISRIPGLAMLLPRDTLLAMADTVQISFDHKLQLDLKFSDWPGLLKLLREAADAALTPTRQEQVEAIYALMIYVSNLEDHLSLELFVEHTKVAAGWLPNPEDDANVN